MTKLGHFQILLFLITRSYKICKYMYIMLMLDIMIKKTTNYNANVDAYFPGKNMV